MAELRKCSRCRSEIELKYFGINRKGEHNKTCITCLDKKKERDAINIVCDNCGCTRNKGSMSLHKRRYYCLTYNLETKPEFEDWLMEQDYDTLLWEYKELLKDILERRLNGDKTKISHSEYLQQVKNLKEVETPNSTT